MLGTGDRRGPKGWQPRRPDPALTDPDRPGPRAHRHPQDQLHAWVFAQALVWVDSWRDCSRGVRPSYRVLHDVCTAYEFTAGAWLERTPLLQALNRRLEGRW